MQERQGLTVDGIDFFKARNKLVEDFRTTDKKLTEDPYIQQQIQGLEEVMTFTSREEFEARIDFLSAEYSVQREEEKRTPDDGQIHYVVKSGLIAERLNMIERVYECSKFFWEGKGPFDPEALIFLQYALNQPIWSDEWRFKYGVRPPMIIADDDPQKDLKEKIDIGRRVKVSSRWSRPGWTHPDEARVGEIIAIAPVKEACIFGSMAVIRDDDNWVFATPLGNIDLLFAE